MNAQNPATASPPAYDRSRLTPGIVHIGLGNFHRAHMAVYLDDLFAMDEGLDWAILGAGVRAPDVRMREALQLSRNIPVVELTDALGPAKLVSAMEKAGMKPVFPGDTLIIESEMLKVKRSIAQATARITVNGQVVSEADLMFSVVDR